MPPESGYSLFLHKPAQNKKPLLDTTWPFLGPWVPSSADLHFKLQDKARGQAAVHKLQLEPSKQTRPTMALIPPSLITLGIFCCKG